jgi:O-antigen/teichoic acid export membrane protein
LKIIHSIGSNFFGGVWTGLLVVLSTPFLVEKQGLEGLGLIGFWQLLIIISGIFDFGLGQAMVREFSRYKGLAVADLKYQELLRTLEIIYTLVALIIGLFIYIVSDALAGNWLKLVTISNEEAALLIKLMSGSIAFQFISTLYINGLSGKQRHGRMNILMMLANTLKYFGGVVVLYIDNSLTLFFAYQIFVAVSILWLTRHSLYSLFYNDQKIKKVRFNLNCLAGLSKYSIGMFMTAICGLLLANVDRIMLSKFVSADDFGRYTLAFTAAGLLQMIILAFYRTYFPRFAELKAAGNEMLLKRTYYEGCSYVGAVIVPTSIAACIFAEELFQIWMGRSDHVVISSFRLLLIATTLSGLMWLPAALQQALGWTNLHVKLMILALAFGVPILFYGVIWYDTIGATALMLTHGIIEITLGLWLMNRILYPKENIKWYLTVLFFPILISAPIAITSSALMPFGLDRYLNFLWLSITGLIMLMGTVITCWYRTKKNWSNRNEENK